MSVQNNLDYIKNNLSDLQEKLETIKTRVKHGKLKIQRKKIKAQVLKDSKPRDTKREEICKNARKKAHTVVANAKRNISNDVRKSVKEGLQVVNPKALTLSEAFGLDFMEESCGYGLDVTFFEKAEITPVSEGLDVGTTKTGRKRKCKAIGVAEGVFAPIEDSEGNSVFSRNKRLYESGFWGYQLENANLADRVSTRRMLGTIGHYDKKVDDKDLAEGKVSHIVTDLEIREDDVNGRYLWGRLEILNTPAGRLLKEYYDNEIPLFVSSRGGGKLLDVPGKDYKMVDKARYYCETFDVVKEPGFLEACPEYHSESADNYNTLVESLEDSTEQKEDINMSEEQVKCNIKLEDSLEEVVRKVTEPMNETLATLTSLVEKLSNDIYAVSEETEEPAAEVEAPVEEPKAEEIAEEPKEAPVEEAKEEEKEDKKCAKCDKEECECDKEEKEEPVKEEAEEPAEPVAEEPAEEPKEEAPAEEPVAEAKDPLKAPEHQDSTAEKECKAEEPKDKAVVDAQIDPALKDGEVPASVAVKEEQEEVAEAPVEEPKAEEEPAAEPVKEEAEEPKAEEPKEEAPVEEPKAEEKVEEATEEPAGEVAPTEMQVPDYKTMYEQMKNEVDEATKRIEDSIELVSDMGKKYKEVVEKCTSIEKELSSYKLAEKFNITVEEANEKLSSSTVETVEEELKEAEAQKEEVEVQAKAEQVSESVETEEIVEAKAPASRRVFSAFSAKESISESNGRAGRRVFSWFN